MAWELALGEPLSVGLVWDSESVLASGSASAWESALALVKEVGRPVEMRKRW